MAVTHIHQDTDTLSGSDSLSTGAEDYLADDIIVVCARSAGPGANLAAIAGGGLTWHEAYSEFVTGGGLQSQFYIWWAHVPANATFDVELSPDTPSTTWHVQAVISVFRGANIVDPIAQVAAGAYASGVSSITVTGQSPESVTVAYFAFHGTSTPSFTPPAGFDVQVNPSPAITNYRFEWAVAEPAVDGNPLDFSISSTALSQMMDVAIEVQPRAGWVVGAIAF